MQKDLSEWIDVTGIRFSEDIINKINLPCTRD
jgi:hypothetical protein